MDKKAFGKEGELKAMEFLRNKGYRIIKTNYLKRTGEIDIVAFDPEYSEYVFVEVKTRRNLQFGYPEEAVNNKKISKIEKTADRWLKDNNIDEPEWRIDIISIEWNNSKPEIRHIENVS